MFDPKTSQNTRRPRGAIIVTFLCTMVLCALVNSVVMAQADPKRSDIDSPGLLVEGSIGWGNIIDQSRPVPVAFLVRNDSERNFEGILELTDLDRNRKLSLGEVVVAPGTSRRLNSIHKLIDWHDCIATIRRGNKVVWRRDMNLSAGRLIEHNSNYVLFVDDGGRKLNLPGDDFDVSTTIVTYEVPVAGISGRPIRTVTLKPWQVNNHPATLMIAMAMVFPETAAERDLNQVQWKAIGQWVCEGGTVFVNSNSRELITRLVESIPLVSETASQSGPFTVRRFGLGAIYEYNDPLMTSQSQEIKLAIADVAAQLSRNHVNSFFDSGMVFFSRGGQTDQNRLWIGGLFGIYTLLSGLGSLMLFRLSQKRMAMYIITVVFCASLAAAGLGGYLRLSKGDLRWLSVTEAGEGGLVQVALLDVQSAGSRNTHVAVKGDNADLQLIANPVNRFYQQTMMSGYSPFTWQPNLLQSEKDTYQIGVPMSPWGHMRCHASAIRRNPQRLEIELEYKPGGPPQPTAGEQTSGESAISPLTSKPQPLTFTDELLKGDFKLKIENKLPFSIRNCTLVIGISRPAAPNSQNNAGVLVQRGRNRVFTNVQGQNMIDGLVDVYHQQPVANISVEGHHSSEFAANFGTAQQYWSHGGTWPYGSRLPPRIPRVGMACAWIIGSIDESPILEIDEDHSDFITQQSFHNFVQLITPDQMPESLKLILQAITAEAEKAEPPQAQ